MKYILECCVDSAESAILAEKGGANRLELCGNLIIGGTTPSLALYHEIRKHTHIRIHALIRPRFGDFLYTDHEMNIMEEEIEAFREAGADGVVIGCLDADGNLDEAKMSRLMKAAGSMSVTLHRAFDVCRDPFAALELCKKLGVNTILTSGQKQSSLEGAELIAELANRTGEDGPDIMAGAGVNAKVIGELLGKTPLTSFHMSGKVTLPSGMQFRKEGVNMGLPSLSEFEIWQTSEEAVRAAYEVLINGIKAREVAGHHE